MQKSLRGPAGDRAEDLQDNSKVAVNEFKPCANLGQTSLPDHRLLKGDLLEAAIQVRRAQTALMDALYVLESQLEASLEFDEEAGR